MKKTPFL